MSFIVLGMGLMIMLYVSPWKPGLSIWVGRVLDLPVARIDGVAVGLGRVSRDSAALAFLQVEDAGLTEQEILTAVWEYIRKELALRSMASQEGVTWTEAEVDTALESFLVQNELTYADLLSIPSFDLRSFREHTVLPMLLETKLLKKLLLEEDSESSIEARRLHEELLRAPASFEKLARLRAVSQHIAFSSDPILVAATELPLDEAALLRSVPRGGITPIIVRIDGYRIYQIVEYFTEPEEAWQLREIFIPGPTLAEAIQARIDAQEIAVYIEDLFNG